MAETKKKATKQRGAGPRKSTAEPVEPAQVSIVDAENKPVRELSLSPDVFGVPVNEHLMYEAVKQYRAAARRGTHSTKTRAQVAGSGRKPWRQKGTGRAQVGSVRTPIWRHGGTVFGPTPRDYSFRMPRKARAAALRSALSQRVSEGALKVVDAIKIETRADGERARLTKQLTAILERLGVAGKALIVDAQPSAALVLSGRNIPTLKVVDESHLSVYDVLDCRTLIVSQAALNKLEDRLAP